MKTERFPSGKVGLRATTPKVVGTAKDWPPGFVALEFRNCVAEWPTVDGVPVGGAELVAEAADDGHPLAVLRFEGQTFMFPVAELVAV